MSRRPLRPYNLVFKVKTVIERVNHVLVTAEPLPLTELSRRVIRHQLAYSRMPDIHRLPLPTMLKNYLICR